MNTNTNKTSENKSRVQENNLPIINNSRLAIQVAQVQKAEVNQKKKNNTDLPDNLKSGIENLSDIAMDDVKVHYDSKKPAQLQAQAYAQGTDINFGTGQEKHLSHEAFHIVQQKQGRVKPTKQIKDNTTIKKDTSLEKEANVMGLRALKTK
ncbi:DUF4157 domain-containing protein [Flavobacterium sp.]|uniref:eCIS core domain-containing protein n=1 Tax=Flavobacterium sp. TaxID=239 RepID=UPI00374FE5BA